MIKNNIWEGKQNFDDNEKKYWVAMEKMKINEESRLFFVKCSMEKFSKIFEEFTIASFDFLNRLNTQLVEIKIEDDIKLFFNAIQII